MRRLRTIGLLVLAFVTTACAASPVHRPSESGHSSASTSPEAKAPETILDLPAIGSVSWTCKGIEPTEFSTTFSADISTPTEKVGYSLNGAPIVYKILQPGKHLSTPFTSATSHVWTVDQEIDPWNTYVTITVALSPDFVVGCVNPSVTVTRVRVNNT